MGFASASIHETSWLSFPSFEKSCILYARGMYACVCMQSNNSLMLECMMPSNKIWYILADLHKLGMLFHQDQLILGKKPVNI